MRSALVKALLFAIPFGVLTGAGYYLESSLAAAVVVGVASGVAAALGVACYIMWRKRRFAAWAAKVCAPYESEDIVLHGHAVAGASGNTAAVAALAVISAGAAARLDAGGLLVLTRQRLLFVPHAHNRFGQQLDLSLSEILGAGPGYGFLGNRIMIGTRSRTTLYFRVDDRAKWIAALPGKKLSAPSSAPSAGA